MYYLPGRKVRAKFENPRGGIRSLAAAPDAVASTTPTNAAIRSSRARTNAAATKPKAPSTTTIPA